MFFLQQQIVFPKGKKFVVVEDKQKVNLYTSSITVACFISKIQQFELPSFHSAWHQNRNAVSLKKSLLLILSSITIQVLEVLEDMFIRTYASSRVKRKGFFRKSELQMFLLISRGHNKNNLLVQIALRRCVKRFGK